MVYWLETEQKHLAIFSGTFLYATLFMTPDLDLAHKIKLFSLRGLLSLPFRSYSFFFKHRGLSHHIIFGTLSRLLWLFGIYLLILYAIYKNIDGYQKFTKFLLKNKEFSLYAFLGILLADLAHIFLDQIPKKGLKR